ncbi:MAG: lytic transglycosylase domain-containing protein, partial [Prevotellaceae bacterium]|nr:lytic transglycosylase domain-containing protein [Prevotellaceae bacterium]
MRGKFLFAALIVTGAVALLVPVLLSHETATRVDTYSIRADVPYMVSPPVVPSEAVFAGDTVDLRRYDMRERMDRELMSFTYMHSSTMLIIKKANRLYPVIEPILKEQGVPDDLKYLMTIESNLNMRAVSPAGAAGLWQFMAGTARDNGLEVNANIDERYNVEKATRAACAHLKSLYERFGDWLTVGAAYNAGHGRIGGERTRQGREEAVDLWLNEETSRYMF